MLLLGNGQGFIDPHSGIGQTNGRFDVNAFQSALQTFLGDFYKYVYAAYWIVIGLCIFAFIYSIVQYMSSTLNASPMLRDRAKNGIFSSLILLATCGAVPFIFTLIINLYNFFR